MEKHTKRFRGKHFNGKTIETEKDLAFDWEYCIREQRLKFHYETENLSRKRYQSVLQHPLWFSTSILGSR